MKHGEAKMVRRRWYKVLLWYKTSQQEKKLYVDHNYKYSHKTWTAFLYINILNTKAVHVPSKVNLTYYHFRKVSQHS